MKEFWQTVVLTFCLVKRAFVQKKAFVEVSYVNW